MSAAAGPAGNGRTAEYDLVVIGAGMAGINAAARAVEAGARVAVVERDRVGGTCPIRGCIPTKALIRSAEVAHLARRAGEFGIRVGEVEVDFAAVMERVRGIVDRGSSGAHRYLESLPGLDLIFGEARLAGPHAVEVDGRILGAAGIVVATGATPWVPPIAGLAETGYLSSDDVLRLDELPSRLVVVGAGPIGLELGQALARLGARVTIADMLPRILPEGEPELAELLAGMLEAEGIELRLGLEIVRADRSADGTKQLLVRQGDEVHVLEGDEILIATGRRPAVGGLALDSAGVSWSERGIPVDETLRTIQPSVWAAGDVVGLPHGAFTHIARRHGVVAAESALGLDVPTVDPDHGPRAIFTDPELVGVGLTEAQALAAGHEVRVGTSRFSGGKARALGEEHGLVKVVAEAGSGRILGAHLLAHHGADLIHPILVAMEAGDGSGEPIRRAYHVHPTLGETVKAAVEQTLPPRAPRPAAPDPGAAPSVLGADGS